MQNLVVAFLNDAEIHFVPEFDETGDSILSAQILTGYTPENPSYEEAPQWFVDALNSHCKEDILCQIEHETATLN